MTTDSPDHPHEPPDDAEHPKTLRLTSKPFEETSSEAADRLEQWAEGEPVPRVVNFQDASRLQRVLTSRRLELVESLMNEPADSIRSLAERLERDVRQVHDDLQLLNEYRIVHFEEHGGAKRAFVPYDSVTIEVEMVKSSEDASESTASV